MNNICPVCGNVVQNASTACDMCGFNLVGSTQAFKAVADVVEAQSGGLAVGCQLRVLRGPQVDMVFKLEQDSMSVGRNPHCDIFLNDMTVSRRHAILRKTGSTYEIEDDNSFNGVWINGAARERAVLNPGDQVQIGVFRLAFEQE